MWSYPAQSFTHFIRDRYNLSYNVSDWIHVTNDDIKPLEKLKEKVDGVIKTEKYIIKIFRWCYKAL